jgi:hypothetical protein
MSFPRSGRIFVSRARRGWQVLLWLWLLLAPVWTPVPLRPSHREGGTLLAQQESDPMAAEEAKRKAAFLKAREEMRTLPLPPRQNTSQAKPTPAPPPTASPAATAPPHAGATPRVAPTPAPSTSATPAPVFQPEPQVQAPVVIEKSGGSDHTDYAPPPARQRGFLGLFGGGPTYRYLTRSVLAAIDNAHVRGGRWKYIVVHNSGTRQGNAAIFDYYHRHTRHMPNGLAYHFVIGNGTSTGDGQIEIGDRWVRQINGGHVHSDYLNNIALGICLVGDFNRDLPTRAQYAALDELITYLRKRVGRVDRRLSIVKAHKEINPVPTDCPGDRFSYTWLHRKFD